MMYRIYNSLYKYLLYIIMFYILKIYLCSFTVYELSYILYPVLRVWLPIKYILSSIILFRIPHCSIIIIIIISIIILSYIFVEVRQTIFWSSCCYAEGRNLEVEAAL